MQLRFHACLHQVAEKYFGNWNGLGGSTKGLTNVNYDNYTTILNIVNLIKICDK